MCSIRYIFYSIFATIWLLLACSCMDAAHPPLRLGTNVWVGYEPLYLARAFGYLDPQMVTLVEYLSASEVMRAFRNQSLEAAALTLDEVLFLQQQQVPVHVFLVMDISHGADAIVASTTIRDGRELKGKRIGAETTALGAYVLARALEHYGLALHDITLVPLEISEHVAAYKAGKIDAVVTFEPSRTHLLSLGAREIFTSRNIPGEIVDVLVVHRDSLLMHAERARHVVQGWFWALDYLTQHPDAAAEQMSKRLRLSPAEVLKSYAGITFPGMRENYVLLGGAVPQLLLVAQNLQKIMLDKHLLQSPVDLQRLFLTAALP